MVVLWRCSAMQRHSSLQHTMRYQLPAWLFMIIGYGGRTMGSTLSKMAGRLVLLWAGRASFPGECRLEAVYCWPYSFRSQSPPWQVILPMADKSEPLPLIVGYRVPHKRLEWPSNELFAARTVLRPSRHRHTGRSAIHTSSNFKCATALSFRRGCGYFSGKA